MHLEETGSIFQVDHDIHVNCIKYISKNIQLQCYHSKHKNNNPVKAKKEHSFESSVYKTSNLSLSQPNLFRQKIARRTINDDPHHHCHVHQEVLQVQPLPTAIQEII